MLYIRSVCVFVAFLSGFAIPAAATVVEPRELSTIAESERTRIFVLGTPHLSALGEEFDPQSAEPLIARLQSFAPGAVAVEALSPASIRSMQARGGVYDLVLERFAGAALRFGDQARKTLGLSYEETAARAAELAGKAERGEPVDHRMLALHFLALYDLPSAVLQWSYLDEAARSPEDGVPAEIAEILTERLNAPNEIYAIAVPLAKRLGHVRLALVDDHSETDLFVPILQELEAEIAKHPEASKVGAAPFFQKTQKMLSDSNRNGDLMPVYRYYNSPDYSRKDIQTQWDLFLRTRFESGLDRVRLALWDMRNLMIAAHVRRVTARHPGGKVLVIIGGSHKAFLESLLDQAMDIRLVPADSILGTEP